MHNSQGSYAIMGWAARIRSYFKLGCPGLNGATEGWNKGLHLEKGLERQLRCPSGQAIVHNRRRRQGDQMVLREHASDPTEIVTPQRQ